MENLTVKLENGQGELIIREGKAVEPLPLKEPKIINISGDIHTISSFLSKRNSDPGGHSSQFVDPSKVIVTANKKARTITMQLDPENHYGATFTGTLESSDELAPFYINQEKKFNREQLIKLVKFSRLYFDDKTRHADILTSLSKLRIKTETEQKAENDNRGNKVQSFDRKVIDDSGFVQFFTLLIPIFKGFPAVKVQVEICFEPSETGILFWLESPELHEIQESKIEEYFNAELKSCSEFVVINK